MSFIDNYSPVGLTKVFKELLLINQFGFKSKISTDLCKYALEEIVGKYESEYFCFYVLLDPSKTFDRVSCHKLFIELQIRRVPAYLIRILHFWFSHQSM